MGHKLKNQPVQCIHNEYTSQDGHNDWKINTLLSSEAGSEEKKTDLFCTPDWAEHVMPDTAPAPAAKKTFARSLGRQTWSGWRWCSCTVELTARCTVTWCCTPVQSPQVHHHNGQSLYSHRRVGMTGRGGGGAGPDQSDDNYFSVKDKQ